MGPFPAAAMGSSPGMETEETMIGTPNSAAARAAGAPPSGSKFSSPPTGASMIGRVIGRPRKRPVRSMVETSRSTRGRKARLSMAARLRIIVVSVSVAPTR